MPQKKKAASDKISPIKNLFKDIVHKGLINGVSQENINGVNIDSDNIQEIDNIMSQTVDRTPEGTPSHALMNWTIRPLKNGKICVEGEKTVDGNCEMWHSTAIVKRTDANTLHTASGATYVLCGPLDKEAADYYEIPEELQNRFQNGFPEDWEDTWDNFISQSKDKSHSNNTEISDEKIPATKVDQAAPKDRKRPRTNKRKPEKEIQSQQKEERHKTPRRRKSRQSSLSSFSKHSTNKKRVNTPSSSSKSIDVSQLPSTRSGRKVVPVLAYWTGQRIVTTDQGVSFIEQGNPHALFSDSPTLVKDDGREKQLFLRRLATARQLKQKKRSRGSSYLECSDKDCTADSMATEDVGETESQIQSESDSVVADPVRNESTRRVDSEQQSKTGQGEESVSETDSDKASEKVVKRNSASNESKGNYSVKRQHNTGSKNKSQNTGRKSTRIKSSYRGRSEKRQRSSSRRVASCSRLSRELSDHESDRESQGDVTQRRRSSERLRNREAQKDQFEEVTQVRTRWRLPKLKNSVLKTQGVFTCDENSIESETKTANDNKQIKKKRGRPSKGASSEILSSDDIFAEDKGKSSHVKYQNVQSTEKNMQFEDTHINANPNESDVSFINPDTPATLKRSSKTDTQESSHRDYHTLKKTSSSRKGRHKSDIENLDPLNGRPRVDILDEEENNDLPFSFYKTTENIPTNNIVDEDDILTRSVLYSSQNVRSDIATMMEQRRNVCLDNNYSKQVTVNHDLSDSIVQLNNVVQTKAHSEKRYLKQAFTSQFSPFTRQKIVNDSPVVTLNNCNNQLPRNNIHACNVSRHPPPEMLENSSDEDFDPKRGRMFKKPQRVRKHSRKKSANTTPGVSSVGATAATDKRTTQVTPRGQGAEWQNDEIERLKNAVHDIPGHLPEFWQMVACIVKTRSGEECQRFHSSWKQQQQLQTAKPAPPKKQNTSILHPSDICGGVGTLKRKRQLRELMNNHTKECDRDAFDATPYRKRMKSSEVPNSNESALYPTRGPQFQTPSIKTPTGCYLPASLHKKTPRNFFSPSVGFDNNKHGVETYLHRAHRGKRRFQNGSRASSSLKVSGHRIMSDRGINSALFTVTEEHHSDEQEDPDYYFTDSN